MNLTDFVVWYPLTVFAVYHFGHKAIEIAFLLERIAKALEDER